jgi:DNA-binding beta-propeller fold protein YncE
MSISADGTTAYVVDTSRVAVYSRHADSTQWYFSHAFGNTCGSKRKNRHFCLGIEPHGLSVSADGTRAYVVDTSKGRIAVYSRNPGSTTWYFSHAFGSGNLKRPGGIAVSEDELTTVVANLGSGCPGACGWIAMFTRPSIGSTDWVFSGNVNGGELDVALSPDGLTLWGTQVNRGYVLVWTRTSSSSTTWTSRGRFGKSGTGANSFTNPMGIAVSADTLNVWVADFYNERISVWTRSDKESMAWSPSTQFSAFGTGASKLVYPQRVAVTPDGRTVLVSGDGLSQYPAGVVETWTQS